jgi:hypothetical protein
LTAEKESPKELKPEQEEMFLCQILENWDESAIDRIKRSSLSL